MGLSKDNTLLVSKNARWAMGLKTGKFSLDIRTHNSSKNENLPHSVQISQKMFCDPLSFQT